MKGSADFVISKYQRINYVVRNTRSVDSTRARDRNSGNQPDGFFIFWDFFFSFAVNSKEEAHSGKQMDLLPGLFGVLSYGCPGLSIPCPTLSS